MVGNSITLSERQTGHGGKSISIDLAKTTFSRQLGICSVPGFVGPAGLEGQQ